MGFPRLFILLLLLTSSLICLAQLDSTLTALQEIPGKYLSSVESKIDKYRTRITGKTEKTLSKLARWESKIKDLLEKVSPETTQKLFGEGKMTFSSALARLREGKSVIEGYRAQYNAYRDKLNTSFRYLQNQKVALDAELTNPIKSVSNKLNSLEEDVKDAEAVEQFIKERKRELYDLAIKYIGRSKYLQRINKEVFYYAETLKNYREIFTNTEKFEEAAFGILKKIPAFNSFMERNNGLSSLFGSSMGGLSGGPGTPASINYAALGYQSNASIVQSLQQRNYSGPNIQQLTQTSARDLNSPLQELKNQFPDLQGSEEMPDFKPNEMRSKTFRQRLDLGTNLQFGKATNFLPGTADIGLQVAYKLNAKSSIGVGAGYKIGLGTGINNIKLSFAGIGLRSFIDWKLKGNFFVNGGFEYNYNAAFKNIRELPSITGSRVSLWKPSAVLGLNKRYKIGKVKGNMMLLYDFLAVYQLPKTQSLIFRFGYNF